MHFQLRVGLPRLMHPFSRGFIPLFTVSTPEIPFWTCPTGPSSKFFGTRGIYEQIRRWIKERNPSMPFFIFANMNTAHSPYDPPTRYLSRHATSPTSFRMTKKLKDLAARDGYRYMAPPMEVTED